MRKLVAFSLVTVSLVISLQARAELDLPMIHPAPPAIDPLGTDDQDSITIANTMYFLDQDGRYIIAPPGMYLVRARESSYLVLIPNQGRQALILQARTTDHHETISEPIALTLPDQESDIHVVLLQPNGKGLEAMGAVTPVRLRGTDAPTLTEEQIRQALAKKSSPPQTPK